MISAPEIEKTSVGFILEKEPTTSIYAGVVYLSELPSYDELFHKIFTKNQLCIIGPHITAHWKSRQLWVLEDGTPNFKYISETFGEAIGPVADCNGEEFCAHPKTTMKVEDFISYWRQYKEDGYPRDGQCLYLKDWHFTKYCYRVKSVIFKTPTVFIWNKIL
ncbi:jmjC domain-containing protein 4-like [Elysia marginata]|uniref:JmjC domain-containing protein 4-like n=1 Tax=Elysia marginata TaxID=1093978 RepID=A0AAV4G3C5_9GAST|nr:jmjC domain-containing protein 4-like [Elysia marginata]